MIKRMDVGKAVTLYLGVAIGIIVIGVVLMFRDAVLVDEIGRTATLVFLSGLLMVFLPFTVGFTVEYVQKRRKGGQS